MAKEIELKFLDVNPHEIRDRLDGVGAILEAPLYPQVRYVFNIKEGDETQWLRLRTQNDATTLTYKKILGAGAEDVEEHEISVSSEAEALQILERLGFVPKGVQETFRESYMLDDAEVSIDFWPMLNPYVEIEAPTLKKLEAVASRLGFIANLGTAKNTKGLYSDLGIDLDQLQELRFSDEEKQAINALVRGDESPITA